MADNNDEDLYDEFGNYIGPELDSSSDEDDSDDDDELKEAPDDASDVSAEDHNEQDGDGNGMMIVRDDNAASEAVADPMNAIVLHEDKEHYPSASETFGAGVRTAVLDEDAMDIETPIVEPVVTKSHHVVAEGEEDTIAKYTYSDEFLTSVIMSNETTRTRRSVAVVGHLHHGKTSLMDCLMEPTLQQSWGPKASLEDQAYPRYTDTLKSEQERQMSLVSTPMTLLLSDTRGKSYGMTMVDCPGHVQFHDESVAALRVVDGALLVVDAVEGANMMHTELLVRQIVSEGLPIMLCITKMDRLITELQLPPRDAYYKVLHLIESTNQLIQQASHSKRKYPKLCPTKGNVAFGSALHGWFFTLESMAKVYAEQHDDDVGCTLEQFTNRLWGDWYWDPETKQFHTSPNDCVSPRTVERSFVTFCLEPIYKIYSTCLGESEKDTTKALRSLGVLLKKDQLRSSARPLLRAALSKFMETASCGLVDMMARHV